MATNGNSNHDQYAAQAQTTEAPASAENSANNLPKDEVGWYFVEQYYTTMSKSPERLHLFYGKKAQFVCGREAEVVNVAFGRQAIQERIRGMDFQDCKVRISNVDTQGSADNILITVIGEMANKDGEPKKFVQTFVLAQQPSGYFVLNDMLRFLNEDVEEEEPEVPAEEPAPAETTPAAETQPAQEAVAAEPAQEKPATEPEAEKKEEPVAEPAAAAETPAPEPAAAAEAQPVAAVEEKQAPADVEKTIEAIAEEDVSKPEEPKDPAPTPAVAEPAPAAEPTAAPAPAQPEKPKEPEAPKGPPKPMTWASRLAAGVPRAAVPVPAVKPATPPAAAQPRAPAPAPAAAPRAPAPAQPQEAASPAPAPKDQGNEWQTAETKRQSRGPHSAAAQSDKDSTMAYIKLANPAKIDDAKLKEHLTTFGPLVYFDVNREKGCAFIEFKAPAGYAAAVAANPHVLDGQEFLVTARRPKPSAYGGSNYGATRGGVGRGRGGGYEPTRSGSQSGRGGLGQTRGRGGGPRGGRGASQVGAGAA
ncbi:hypothetical protein VTJ49DRAFT_397 [Mycothermus thermophilus]|uniref:Uncharacterized protein n=1 Tax=Humicola insolens TaxID=85995 RepID=A0ABR3VPK0_HUMIN